MRYIAASVQQLNRLCNRIFFVKFNSQDAFLCLPIMDDADIFDADVVQRQKRGDGGDRTCFIRDIQTDRLILFDRAASGGHADLLPHDRGRGGDQRDILKPACSDGFHQSLSIVMILYQMDEGGSNDMR